MMQKKKLQITLIKSKFGRKPKHKKCLQGLGLYRIHQTVKVDNNSCNRGLINKSIYLLQVEEL